MTYDVLAIAGSLRRGSWNRRLLEAADGLAPSDMRVHVYDGLADIPMLDEDREAAGSRLESVVRLRALVGDADGILFATPEYNRSIPGVLKNAIDWLSRSEALAGKPVAVIGATPGRWGTRLAQAELRRVLDATEAAVMPAPALFIASAAERFEENGRLVDEAVRKSLSLVLAGFVGWIEKVR